MTHVSADVLRTHIDYTAWASRRLVEAASQLSQEELVFDFKAADRNILGTLGHLFASDRLWLARLQKAPHPGYARDTDRHLPVLQNDWPHVHGQFKDWAAGLTDKSAESTLTYTDMRGNSWTQPVWQLILHIVNHGSHHRGQVSGFLRALGHTPPPLDLIAFYRGQLPG